MPDKSKQLQDYQQKYGLPGKPRGAAMAAGTAAPISAVSSQTLLQGTVSAAQQAALAASQLLVPLEYLQVHAVCVTAPLCNAVFDMLL